MLAPRGDAIRELMAPPDGANRRIGFLSEVRRRATPAEVASRPSLISSEAGGGRDVTRGNGETMSRRTKTLWRALRTFERTPRGNGRSDCCFVFQIEGSNTATIEALKMYGSLPVEWVLLASMLPWAKRHGFVFRGNRKADAIALLAIACGESGAPFVQPTEIKVAAHLEALSLATEPNRPKMLTQVLDELAKYRRSLSSEELQERLNEMLVTAPQMLERRRTLAEARTTACDEAAQ